MASPQWNSTGESNLKWQTGSQTEVSLTFQPLQYILMVAFWCHGKKTSHKGNIMRFKVIVEE